MMHPALIVFDLDGTLIDSAPDLTYCIDTVLQQLGRPPAGEAAVRSWIGNGVPMLVKRALTGEQWPPDQVAQFDHALALFMDLYSANLSARSTPFPGVLEGLAMLKARGFATACITNKHSRFTMPLLNDTEIAPYLDFVGCGDQFTHHKPHPEPLLKTAEHFTAAPTDCVMVGDSANDVQAARAAGYGAICVTYGYHNCERVEQLRADHYISSFTELPDLFAR